MPKTKKLTAYEFMKEKLNIIGGCEFEIGVNLDKILEDLTPEEKNKLVDELKKQLKSFHILIALLEK